MDGNAVRLPQLWTHVSIPESKTQLKPMTRKCPLAWPPAPLRLC